MPYGPPWSNENSLIKCGVWDPDGGLADGGTLEASWDDEAWDDPDA